MLSGKSPCVGTTYSMICVCIILIHSIDEYVIRYIYIFNKKNQTQSEHIALQHGLPERNDFLTSLSEWYKYKT